RGRLIERRFRQGQPLLHQPAKNVGGRGAGVLERRVELIGAGLLRLGFVGVEIPVEFASRMFFSASQHLLMLEDRRTELNAFLTDVGAHVAGQIPSFDQNSNRCWFLITERATSRGSLGTRAGLSVAGARQVLISFWWHQL